MSIPVDEEEDSDCILVKVCDALLDERFKPRQIVFSLPEHKLTDQEYYGVTGMKYARLFKWFFYGLAAACLLFSILVDKLLLLAGVCTLQAMFWQLEEDDDE